MRAALAGVALCAVLVFPASSSARALYVKAGAAATTGKGTKKAPFATLAAVQSASKAGDRIVVLPAAKPLDGGIALKPRQQLIGAGPKVAGRTKKLKLLPAVQNLTEANLEGDAVRLANGVTVRNIAVRASYRGDIYGLDAVGVKIIGNDLTGQNSSCQNGFLVQPFNVPTGVPGVQVPASAVMPQNAWAALMLDGQNAKGTFVIDRNFVHDSVCGDGIDVRAMGTSKLTGKLRHNTVTRIKEGDIQAAIGSVLAIGMQALDTATLRVTQDHNKQTFIGSEGADCEGQFANVAGSGVIYDTVDHNTFAHGIGGSSCNGFETIVSSGDGKIFAVARNSTFRDNEGDMFEEGNLGAGSVMRFVLENVIVDGTNQRGGNPPGSSDGGNNPIPFNLGDCMVAGNNGGGASTTLIIRNSVLRGCNNGVSLLSNVGAGNGSGPTKDLVAEIVSTTIEKNAKYGIHAATESDVENFSVSVAGSLITGNGQPGVSFEAIGPAVGQLDDAKLNLNRSCLFGNTRADVEATNLSVVAQKNWWGANGPPKASQTIGTVDAKNALTAKPVCGALPPAPPLQP